ncbi:MAG TPA: MoaD/ThiS family protein [Gemmatales bacterium]|nr:MoaD/ThiS family protein [Gemmatales bacterium]HMP16956.1 MoaD/ThiS family protein [Gemmatales bacterium]
MITVQFFAGLRELAGIAITHLSWQPGLTVADVRQLIAKEHPAAARLLERSRIAVNNSLASENTLVPDDAEVALLPPVSGG